MQHRIAMSSLVSILCVSCAGTATFNLSDDAIEKLNGNLLGTYSDYGGEVTYDDETKLYHLKVYVGGLGSCDTGAILYAKPKLDSFMKENQFLSYTVVRGTYSLLPLSHCELFIDFK